MKQFVLGLIAGLLLSGSLILLTKTNHVQNKEIVECITTQVKPQIETVNKQCNESETQISTEKIEKAFLLFLASIGIKKDYAESVKNIVDNPENYQPEITNEDIVEPASESQTQFYYPRNEALKKFDIQVGFRELIDYEPSFKRNENYLLKDAAVYFAKAKTITSLTKIKRYNGVYSGKLYRLAGKHKGKVEDIEMNIEFWEKRKGEIDGKFTMTIARDGEIYSNMRGEGGNNDLYLNPQNTKELIIKAAPGMYFHFIDKNLKSANAYDEGEFIGVSTLKRL
ncbi:MAG: hypothetical protein COV38_08115 [Bdellovibrionales bacterium CG11_big_fil_rev_8_21_14_0_20_38_13]|nr:MAG: hypothetical protein COW79_07115 [Bdellovibrionales bacterium CG22_combo_CG10-13_8_21_14_all_38_13]PIR29902.1 MAG: hypothetical protein COV38_08115 [Bdellovibrionales bacterium CG11_big_fil_rev_8_21_14_0_20_38_13]